MTLDDAVGVQRGELLAHRIVVVREFHAGQRHAVKGFKQPADANRADAHIDRRDLHPHAAGGAVLLERMHVAGGIQPILTVGRRGRLHGIDDDVVHVVALTVGPARLKGHGRALDGCVFRRHRAVIAQVRRIDVYAVREYAQVRAHADELLGQHVLLHGQFHALLPQAVVEELFAVHPCQRIAGGEAQRIGKPRMINAALFPLGEHREMRCGQVLLVVPFAVPDPEVMVVSAEGFDHGAGLVQLRQVRKIGHYTPSSR